MKNISHRQGFTLIEILIYLGLVVLLGTALAVFFWNMSDLRERNELAQSAALEARISTQRIGGLIRNSESLVSFAPDRIELGEPDTSSVTAIFLSDGQLFVDNGTDVSALTGSGVRVTSLQFEEWHAADAPAEIIYYTITFESDQEAGGAPGLQASMSIRGAALLRNNLE